MKIKAFILAAVMLPLMFSCENDESGEQESLTSTSQSSKSHNTGQECLSCHKQGGSGEGWFTVAGTVYNSTQTVPYITATVELRTGQSGGGTLVKSVQVDQKGNFYTTDAVDYGTGLYVSVIGGTSTQHMNSKVTTGACNSCHDSSRRIWGN